MAYTYEKQLWKDYPDTTTPITADRLNHMEDGISEAAKSGGGDTIPVGSEFDYDGTTVPDGYEKVNNVLYDNETGTTDNITLSDDSSNYSYIEIYYHRTTSDSVDIYNSTKIYSPNGKNVELLVINNKSNKLQIGNKIVSINGSEITNVDEKYSNTGETNFGNSNSIYITHIVGYK